MSQKTLKLGTRRSLLAWAQSSWVARTLEHQHPGLQVELVGIDTTGDKILDKPLSQIDGKEFFTAELDFALIDGRVDFTVHSMKDLSLDRPPAIVLGAIPPRELPHDVIVFHESVIERIKRGEEIRIGTSSPRRLTLIPPFLEKALPRFGSGTPNLRFVEIRGNVNTRLSRVHEPESSERKMDGVVLAFAGLERLALGEKASAELWQLLVNTRLMVLPLHECPTAPAQGALAIETHRDRKDIQAILKTMHSKETEAAVARERAILQEWGGGCHQKLGATFTADQLIIKGTKPNDETVEEIRTDHGKEFSKLDGFVKVEAKDLFDFVPRELPASEVGAFKLSEVIFIAHSRAYDYLGAQSLAEKRVWVSGTKSWMKLAEAGVWVEGSLEGHGFHAMGPFFGKKLLRMPKELGFLTHVESRLTGPLLKIATYAHQLREIPDKIVQSEKIYWASSLPFETVWSKLSEPQRKDFAKKTHASGPGKTAAVLRAHGIEPVLTKEY